MADFKTFIEEVKDKNPLIDIIEETGPDFKMVRRGRDKHSHGTVHDSLVVNNEDNLYVWNANGHEAGDIFTWLEKRKNLAFFQALEFLAKRAGLEMPHFDQADGAVKATVRERTREEIWTAASELMQTFLNEDVNVGKYCSDCCCYEIWARGVALRVTPRAWTQETINAARVGWSGGKPEHYERMKATLLAAGQVDLFHPDAICILGFKGDVKAWGERYQVDVLDTWIQNGFIPGLMTKGRLIYPHFERSKCIYFSARNILGGELGYNGGKGIKSFNLPEVLAGKRKIYRNWLVGGGMKETAIVEGQGDAVSLGQMGMAAAAIMGVAPEKFEDELHYMRMAKRDGRELERTVYVGVDADKAGEAALAGDKQDWALARLLGPCSWVLRWNEHPDHQLKIWDATVKTAPGKEKIEPQKPDPQLVPGEAKDEPEGLEGEEKNDIAIELEVEAADPKKTPVKDANDLVRAMAQRKIKATTEEGGQRARFREMLGGAEVQIITMAKWAGKQGGKARQDAERIVFDFLLGVDEGIYKQYEKALKRELKRTDLKSVLDSMRRERERITNPSGYDLEPVEVVSLHIADHLIEMIYDQQNRSGRLAVKYPDGRIEAVESIVVDGRRLIPLNPNDRLLTQDIILLPSALVPVRPTRELAAIIRAFIHRYVDIDPFYERLASFYVIFSWLYDCFPQLCYLRALGDYGTGKTRFITVIGSGCYKPIMTAGATSTASIFRLLDEFRGTLILDEADFGKSDETADIIKILNVGNDARLGNVLRAEDNGNGKYRPVPYLVYGPKIIATRKKFGDQATESRCLTKEMGGGIVRDDVPKVLQDDFWRQAQEIRNLMLAYRLKWWSPSIKIDYNEEKTDVEPRLVQVTLPLKTIIGRDEPDLVEELNGFIHKYNNQLRSERSMTIEAKVIEAIVTLAEASKSKLDGRDSEGNPKLFLKAIAQKSNELIDKENDDDEDGDDKKWHKKLTSKSIGHYLRSKLQCGVDRERNGFYLVWDEKRMDALKMRFGVEDPL
jgi:hypothetical protein